MRIHEKVLDWVTEQLESGQLTIGDHLPSERALAESLGVSRSSLREALRVLEAMGVLQSATGSGQRSGTIVTANPEQALGMAMSFQLASSQMQPEHIFRTRILLETSAMRESNPEGFDVEKTAEILEHMERPDVPIEQFLRLDAQFHVALSRAAENPLLSTLMEAVGLAISDHTLQLSHNLPDWEQTSARLKAEHREILEVLTQGRSAEAAQLLEQHIRGYYQETGQRLS
ncbi:FadR/GntR family transcriptional regulator [Corynebacterium sp.]|uniref:FadR/GntR family transcriptional regulator n=1 Tax=Corynebacterium sp. TaxID=1720 RepID=UPI0026DB8C7F|nr:GntR family transcriptional regulator [Corynebacterium sp.]MDO5031966.1 GntR family transcriptional regulator [Corynebacterium sp.]